jgi:CBS domain-containing protein
MTKKVKDIMTTDIVALDSTTPIVEAARVMHDHDIGDVLVSDGGSLRGIVTDRDIVVRCVAESGDPARTPIGNICSNEVRAVRPDANLDDAAKIMRDLGVRRLPVVEDGKAVGFISIGDLAIASSPKSALGGISAQPANS